MSGGEFFHNDFVVKRRWGQNFLVDKRMVARIVSSCDLRPEETILEIGPGQGALTRELIPLVKRVIAVELDGQLVARLRAEFDPHKLEVHQSDFLKFDFSHIVPPIKVVGNLPYYVSSPIIDRVIEQRQVFSALFMTAQIEFGERLVAAPGSKDYGAMSVMVQFYAQPQLLFKINKRCFRPIPKVTSCFIRMDLRRRPVAEVKNERFFEKVVRQAFLQRRKMLINALSGLATKAHLADVLEKVGLTSQARAENLSVQDFARLSDALLDVQLPGKN